MVILDKEIIMKKKLLIVLLIMMSVCIAQNIVPNTSKMTNTEKMLWYQNEKKSPAKAFIYSWFIPTAGHAYAGDWNRGLILKGSELALFISGLVLINGDNWTSEKESVGVGLIGVSAVVLIFEFYDVLKTTTKYNLQLYKDTFGEEPRMGNSLIPK